MADTSAQDGTVTLYSQSGKPLTVKGSAAFKAAKIKGWSPDKPKGGEQASAQEAPSNGGVTTPTTLPKPYDPLTQTGFGRAMKKSLNPFHSAPEGMKPDSGGKGWDVAEDAFNLRETQAMWDKGNKKGAAGMATGSVIGALGPDLLKGVSEGIKTTGILDKAVSAAGKSEAIRRAISLSGRTLNRELAEAEKLVQPIRDVLNSRFEPMHKALEKQIIPVSQEAQKLIKAVAELEPEMEKEVGNLIRESGKKTSEVASKSVEKANRLKQGATTTTKKVGQRATETTRETMRTVRSALDYREADKLISRLRHFGEESPRIAKIADEIDKEVSKAAHAAGYGQEREALKAGWKAMYDARNIAWDSVKEKGLVKKAVGLVHKGAADLMSDGAKQVSRDAIKEADKVFSQVSGTKPGALLNAFSKAGAVGAKAWKTIPPMWRSLASSMGDDHGTI